MGRRVIGREEIGKLFAEETEKILITASGIGIDMRGSPLVVVPLSLESYWRLTLSKRLANAANIDNACFGINREAATNNYPL